MIELAAFAGGGYLVKTVGVTHLVVRPMRLFRLCEVPVEEPRTIWRYWCYTSFEAAVLAASVWDGAGEPVGWIRRGGAQA